MSTTNTQRELIDFLWDWTNPLGSWSKLLVELVTNKQAALDENERQRVFNYYLQDIGFQFAPPLPPLLTITKPSFTHSSKEVVLTKLSEVKGVNKLAEGQLMEFSPNITIVYGNNGVGKTGYSRVLKSQGYSFDNNIDILSNVHEEQVTQSARIDFNSDGAPCFLDWQGDRIESDLNAVSIFNSDCVNISLSNSRQLLVSPKGFYLFTLITNELSALTYLHTTQYAAYPTLLQWAIQFHETTPQRIYIDALVHNSNKQKLDELSVFKPENLTTLKAKEEELKKLNKAALEIKLKSNQFIIAELTAILANIKQTQSNLTKTDWDAINIYNTRLKELKAKTQLGIVGLAETYGLEQFETDQFSNFLKSADAYIKLLAKENYPNNPEDTCVYCKQDLQSQEAKNLVENYTKILNDKTQSEIAEYEKLKRDIVERVNLMIESIVFHHPAFGVLEDDNVKQPREIIDFNTKIKFFKDHIVNNTVTTQHEFGINYTAIIQFLEAKLTERTSAQTTILKLLANLTETEVKLKVEIAELKDRKLLSENKESVLTVITNLLSRKLLDDNKAQFNTNSLSIKTTHAREELVAQDFQQKFTAELTGFRKQHLDINLNFFSQQGSSRIRQSIAHFEINKVLSEGEQKTIALCEFLTELQLDTTVAPVVFDDPVNSLDHLIIHDVAERLLKLSRERQVIVFTHNVIFYNTFFELQSGRSFADLNFKFYEVFRNENITGLLKTGDPINKLTTYTKELNILTNSSLEGKDEQKEAAKGYDYLRTSL